jgi:serpin B
MNRWVISIIAILFLVGCAPTIVQTVQTAESALGQNDSLPSAEAEVPKAEAPVLDEGTPNPAPATPDVPELPAFEMPENAEGAAEGENPTTPMVPEEDLARATESNNRFALEVLEILRADTPNNNILYSPVSIYTAFAMLYAGAAGDTATQLADVLHYDLDSAQLHPTLAALEAMLTANGKAGFTLNIANGIWSQQDEGYTIDFVDTLSRHYRTAIQWLDFAGNPQGAADAVNQWVNQATNGKIPSIVEGFNPNTALVLANAIYFNAEWEKPFEQDATQPAPFTAVDGTAKEVTMMRVTDSFAHAEGENYQMVALPYAGGTARMVVILPAEGEFTTFEQAFTADSLATMLADLETAPSEVVLTLPKFEYETTMDLVDVLGKLGLTLPFGDQADFSGINGTGGLSVDQAVHKAKIAVDEVGTEAAATTVIGVVTLSAPMESESVTMTVDRPFLYFIQDTQTGALLFVGRIVTLE